MRGSLMAYHKPWGNKVKVIRVLLHFISLQCVRKWVNAPFCTAGVFLIQLLTSPLLPRQLGRTLHLMIWRSRNYHWRIPNAAHRASGESLQRRTRMYTWWQIRLGLPPVCFYESNVNGKIGKGGSRKSLTLHAWWMLVLGMRERNGC